MSSQEDVRVKKNWNACTYCLKASSQASKGDGIYYDAIKRTYVTGKDLPVFADQRALVLDLHNVTDLLSPTEFASQMMLLTGVFDVVCLLSYVGTTTDTRISAEKDMREFHRVAPGIYGYLCFKRGDVCATGNKGDFIARLGAQQVCFLDDSEDHIQAGISAGAQTFLIPTGALGKQAVLDVLAKLAHH